MRLIENYLFILLGNSFRFFVPLKPHHVFGVKPPWLLLQRLCGQVLGFSPFQVVKDEKESLGREPMEKIQRIGCQRNRLWIVGRRHVGWSRKVMPQPFRVRGVRHVIKCGFQWLVLNLKNRTNKHFFNLNRSSWHSWRNPWRKSAHLLFFTERHRSERSDTEQRRNVSFACGRGRLRN